MSAGARWRAVAARGALFAAGWWVLTGGSWASPILAALSVAAATGASLALVPHGSWRWTARGIVGFVPFFLWQSVLGGVDVGRRALSPRMRLRPGYLEYRFGRLEEPGRVFMVTALSLLPGTLGTALSGDVVRVHVLDAGLPNEARLRELEDRVAELFGMPPRA